MNDITFCSKTSTLDMIYLNDEKLIILLANKDKYNTYKHCYNKEGQKFGVRINQEPYKIEIYQRHSLRRTTNKKEVTNNEIV